MRSHVAWALALLLLGCVANANRARHYENEAHWEDAYQEWTRVAADAGPPFASEADLAVIHYELARSAGVTCRWDEAVKEFMVAYDYDRTSGGPSDMAMFELGDLYACRKDWTHAVQYYERGFAELERLGKWKQIHVADRLYAWNQYAAALRGAGRAADAEAVEAKARALAATAEREHVMHPTPYGSQCAPGLAQR